MINLSIKADREKLEEQIENEINEYCVKLYDDGEHRKHLGASIIGDPCSRQLWYTFRWCKRQTFDGRMHRLFNVGNDAEPRFASYLKGIGFEVLRIDPETNKQFRMTGINGHYGGSVDARLKAPARYNLTEDLIFLGEFKTNNTGAGFTNVDKEGVAKAKPRHYAQACQYGYKFNLKYCIYLIENKNDSDLTVKIFELDHNYGRVLEKKAEDIIYAKTPPARISETPSYFECKYCDYSDICHSQDLVEKNCRSCKFAIPVENKQWSCTRYNQIIPDDFIKIGCDMHLSIASE
jgi:hypothetical protein